MQKAGLYAYSSSECRMENLDPERGYSNNQKWMEDSFVILSELTEVTKVTFNFRHCKNNK